MKFAHVLCITSTLLLAACGDGDTNTPAGTGGTSSNNNNNTPEPGTASEDVTATEGGEVALDDGAGVNIPAGALSDDTEISIESSEPDDSLPDFDSIQGLAYEFGPDGTTFDVPVELTLPLVGTPGANEEAVVSWLNTETNQWEDLETTATRDVVVAETTHFTLFVVRFKGVAADAFTCDFDDTCSGGDLVGAWTIQGGCVDIPNPFETFCADATFDVASTMEGSVTFNDDGTYSSSFTSGGTFHVVIPASCLQGAAGTCLEALDADSGEDGGATWTCTGSPAEGCDCDVTGEMETKQETGTYTTDGNQLSMLGEGDTEADPITYCVDGNSFKAKQVEQKDGDAGATTTIIWSATR